MKTRYQEMFADMKTMTNNTTATLWLWILVILWTFNGLNAMATREEGRMLNTTVSEIDRSIRKSTEGTWEIELPNSRLDQEKLGGILQHLRQKAQEREMLLDKTKEGKKIRITLQ